jgi:hypothetical protein
VVVLLAALSAAPNVLLWRLKRKNFYHGALPLLLTMIMTTGGSDEVMDIAIANLPPH